MGVEYLCLTTQLARCKISIGEFGVDQGVKFVWPS